MRRRASPLFNKESFSDVSRQKIEAMKQEVQSEDADRIAGSDREEYVDYLVSKYSISPIEVATDKAQIEAESFSPDEDLTLLIPVAGNTAVLGFTPSTRTIGYAVRGKVVGNELQVELRKSGRRGWSEDSLNKEFERTTDHIDTYLDRLERQISKYHDQLLNEASRTFERRREPFLKRTAPLLDPL